MKAKAKKEAESIKDEAQKKAEETAKKAKDEAKKVKESAEEEAKSVKKKAEKEAEKEAENLNSAASNEAAKIIAAAQEEAETIKEIAHQDAVQIEAGRKTSEENAAQELAEKEQTELEAAAIDEAKVTEIELGLTEGFAWKMEHINEERPDISEKSESYQAGYRAGFQNAEDALKEPSKEAGKEDGKTAGVELEKSEWVSVIPKTVKADIYKESYLAAAEKSEKDYFEKLKAEAKDLAFDDYVVGKKKAEPESKIAVSQKGKEYFENEYHMSLNEAEIELSTLKETVVEQAEIDGKNRSSKSDKSYRYLNINGSKFYEEYDKLYKETYKKARSEEDRKSFFILALSVGTIVSGAVWLAYGRKSKMTNR